MKKFKDDAHTRRLAAERQARRRAKLKAQKQETEIGSTRSGFLKDGTFWGTPAEFLRHVESVPDYEAKIHERVQKAPGYLAWKAESDARDEECRAICRRQLEEHLATLTPKQRENYGKTDAELVEESRAMMGIKPVDTSTWRERQGLSQFIEDDEAEDEDGEA